MMEVSRDVSRCSDTIEYTIFAHGRKKQRSGRGTGYKLTVKTGDNQSFLNFLSTTDMKEIRVRRTVLVIER